MLALGFMTLNLKSENSYFTELAKNAAKYQIQCFRFVPSQINPVTEKVVGEEFVEESQTWRKGEFTLPVCLYDRCFYGDDAHSKQCMAIVNWLKTRKDIQFLGYGLPNKMELYHVLSQSRLAAYIPKTIKVESSSQVIHTLEAINPLILKPINGSQGYGIYYIEKIDGNFIVRTDKKEKQISRTFETDQQLLKWLETLLQKITFLLQPYLPLTNDDEQPYDVRSLLQKNETNNWDIIGKGVRVGQKGGIISNLSAGATILPFNDWLDSASVRSKNYICEEIDYILKNLPLILEQHFLPLFELGVDIGIAKNGAIWLLDVNSKPGRKVISTIAPKKKEQLMESPLRFANVLVNKVIPERSQ
ncbi:YheC/YheD family protein [Bacillus sp. 31A1R]|uniref:YheC/YheD family protein n=1 Tax=Robertmurraya mangrovi TaxID=3098077 RepID=A0ABU5ISR1_9BACI|nr:YheC/YheD family protein [Bacillus sp. 31A1R]MDZ5470179.1 YheC/YheD family protein [Bacillus sp. 31A1R]